jgi:hypothetical protein
MAKDWVTHDDAVKILEREFIPYGIALRLYQLGFNEPCFAFYSNQIAGRNFYLIIGSIVNQQEQYHGQICSAPLWQQAFKWFRNKGFYGSIDSCEGLNTWKIASIHLDTDKHSENISDYNEAQIACLLELINIYLQYLNA